MALMAIVPGMALEGVGGLVEATVAEEDEEEMVEMVVLERMEEEGERGQWEELEELEVLEELEELEELVEMVLMQTVPGMVLEAAMETRKAHGRNRAGRVMETVWKIETERVLEQRAQRRNSSVHKLWAARDGQCKPG